MISRREAQEIFDGLIQNPSLRRHCRTVELVMEAYAEKLGEDKDKWAITGLLHDADYEKYPEEHPHVIVKQLREMGEEEIAYAISAHYTKWGVSYDHLLDKALLACDELTGFIVACALVRPTKIEGLKAKSVRKKLKDKKFAAKVEREEIQVGVELLGVDLNEHIAFIVEVLERNKEELGLEAA
ncbi:MAG: HD domain-containing protein [Bacteroidota bacterium]